MTRAAIQACLPWLAALVVSLAALCLLVRVGQARIELGRLRRLHADEGGAAQTLSFVLTLPIFVMVMLFIVQVSQIMIGTVVVNYAAYAAAQSAVVWIPACMDDGETENCISSFEPDPQAPDQVMPNLAQGTSGYGPTGGGVTYLVAPGSAKYNKILSAAVLACMPISPSRNVKLSVPDQSAATSSALKAVYAAMIPSSQSNSMVPVCLDNKLAYATANTAVEVRFFHKNLEPPLQVAYGWNPNVAQFLPNEVGWQDQVTVTVRYNFPLLPGVGGLLSAICSNANQAAGATPQGNVYTYPLVAEATMGNEGEASVVSYVYPSE